MKFGRVFFGLKFYKHHIGFDSKIYQRGNIQSLISAIRKKFSEKKIVLTSSTKNQYFDSNITVINKNSDKFIKILAKAHIIINDSLLPNYFIKKANQLVIHC